MNLKIFSALFISSLLLVLQCRSSELPEKIADKKRLSKKIDSLKKALSIKEVEVYVATDRGGALKTYSGNGILKNAILEIWLSNKDISYSFYYEGSKCFFVQAIESFYAMNKETLVIDFTKVRKQNVALYVDNENQFFALNSDTGSITKIDDARNDWLRDMSQKLYKAFQSGEKKLDLHKMITK